MGVIQKVLTWIGAPNESAESIRKEVHEKALRRREIIERTREKAQEVIHEEGDGMSFDELAHTVGLREEASRETDGEDDRAL